MQSWTVVKPNPKPNIESNFLIIFDTQSKIALIYICIGFGLQRDWLKN